MCTFQDIQEYLIEQSLTIVDKNADLANAANALAEAAQYALAKKVTVTSKDGNSVSRVVLNDDTSTATVVDSRECMIFSTAYTNTFSYFSLQLKFIGNIYVDIVMIKEISFH